MNRKEIGQKIKKLRIEKNYTQHKLAVEAGISPSYIPDIEKGLKCPTIETLDSICFALNISLSDFLCEKEKEPDRIAALTEKQKKLLNDFLNSL